ncbi:MAG TPA: hypothetical protein VNS63_22210 [Blastocatellia bacterium]|nr:hypothetical protein [Blastocatellia bacterium]
MRMISVSALRRSTSAAFMVALVVLVFRPVNAQATRSLSGVLVTDLNEAVPGASVVARYSSGEQSTGSDESPV